MTWKQVNQFVRQSRINSRLALDVRVLHQRRCCVLDHRSEHNGKIYGLRREVTFTEISCFSSPETFANSLCGMMRKDIEFYLLTGKESTDGT